MNFFFLGRVIFAVVVIVTDLLKEVELKSGVQEPCLTGRLSRWKSVMVLKAKGWQSWPPTISLHMIRKQIRKFLE